MVVLDMEKYNECKKIELVLRPDFGSSPPIKVGFIRNISTDTETNAISMVDYVHPATFKNHWAYGHQVDEVLYIVK